MKVSVYFGHLSFINQPSKKNHRLNSLRQKGYQISVKNCIFEDLFNKNSIGHFGARDDQTIRNRFFLLNHENQIELWHFFCWRLLRPAYVTFLKTGWWKSNVRTSKVFKVIQSNTKDPVFEMKIPWSWKKKNKVQVSGQNDEKFRKLASLPQYFTQKIHTREHYFPKKFYYVIEIMVLLLSRYRIQIQRGPAEKRHQRQPSR